jgi:predicted  nucleic acid-binding Zn-ribbon protein
MENDELLNSLQRLTNVISEIQEREKIYIHQMQIIHDRILKAETQIETLQRKLERISRPSS